MTQDSQSTPAVSNRYSVIAGDVERDRQTTLHVWQIGGFAATAGGDEARYDWYYLKNPAGAGQLSLLRCDTAEAVSTTVNEDTVGSLGVCPRQMSLDGRPFLAGVLVDFVVSPLHRTALPALQLQRAARARAHETAAVLYGLPDTKAVPIFKRLGAQVQFPLPSYTRVLRTARYFARVMPAWASRAAGLLVDTFDIALLRLRVAAGTLTGTRCSGAWVGAFNADFDRLWRDFKKDGLCVGVRDAAFLQWRFGARPGANFRTFVVRDSRTKELRAYFVCELLEGGVAVKDCLSVGSRRDLVHALNLLCLAARKIGGDALYLQIVAPGFFGDALRKTWFRQRSSRPFFASVKPTSADAGADFGAAGWYVTQADEDV